MEYQDRINRPLGMSDVDLLIYDKDIYTLYRTHEGLETDAFRYDPIVSAGLLASDYAYAQGMAWVNLLTPASQDKINPGDNLIVPVRTYDYYGENPPIEKYLTHEVSYTANQLNLERAMSLGNEFVGDFSYYFDNESRLISGKGISSASDEEAPTIPSIPNTPRGVVGILNEDAPVSPKPVNIPRSIFTGVLPKPKPKITDKKPNYKYIASLNNAKGTLTQLKKTLETCIRYCESFDIDTTSNCKKLIDRIKALEIATSINTPRGGGGIFTGGGSVPRPITTTPTPPTTSGSGTPKPSTNGGDVISGGAMGGGGGAMGGGGGSAPSEEAPTQETPTQETPKSEEKSQTEKTKQNMYMPILIGVAIFGLIGYYYAKKQNKDIKTFGISGAIIGGLLGYLYNQHQEKPIEFISKLGIKSKNE